MEDITPFLPGDTVAYLRIADGDRKFPFRPMGAGLFLIGHGRSCDLRLGNKDVSAIHSVVEVQSHFAEITRVGSSPELVVNGEEVDHCRLHHGDMIEIGDVRCVFALCHPETEALIRLAETETPQSPASSEDLVNRIEAEFQVIDSQESSPERVLELLTAAQKAVDGCAMSETIRLDDYKAQKKAIESSESAMDTIVLTHLRAQQSRLDEICGVLEQVVHQQQLIASALRCLVEQIDALRSSATSPPNLRASA
ncbi:MAG: FHA domain-containing protein [Planctomycetota bacterium]